MMDGHRKTSYPNTAVYLTEYNSGQGLSKHPMSRFVTFIIVNKKTSVYINHLL